LKTLVQITTKLSAFVLFTIASTTSAFATGGTAIFSLPGAGSPTAVPSLSGSMLIVLSLLLFIVAFKVSKQKNSNPSKFFMMLIGTGILVSAGSGIKLVSDANAGAPTVPTPITIDEEIRVESTSGGFFGTNDSLSNINVSVTTDEISEQGESSCLFVITPQETFDRIVELQQLIFNISIDEEAEPNVDRRALIDELENIQSELRQIAQIVESGETQTGIIPSGNLIQITCSQLLLQGPELDNPT